MAKTPINALRPFSTLTRRCGQQFRRAAAALAVLGFVFAANATHAAQAEVGSITVENAWTRATPKGAKVGAGYLTIKNDGEAPDRLVSASVGFAGQTEMHQSSMVDGMMKMRPVAGGIEIPPKGTVTLGPGGYHLMFMQLTVPLNEGDSVSGELVFERAGKVDVVFKVLGMGAQGPGEDVHHQKKPIGARSHSAAGCRATSGIVRSSKSRAV